MVVDSPSSGGKYGSILLAINQEGSFNFDTSSLDSDNQAYFTILGEDTISKKSEVSLSSIPALYASFFDFDEVG